MEPAVYKGCIDIIRNNSSPLRPKPTGLSFVNTIDRPPRASIFDVYGTLFISGSGDIGTTEMAAKADLFRTSFQSAGFSVRGPDLGTYAEKEFYTRIRQRHEKLRARGIDCPEVDILRIWRDVCGAAADNGYITGEYSEKNLYFLAVEYETRANPVWPMGDIEGLVEQLRRKNIIPGIISNAQFYTPLLFPALVGKTAAELGFREDICTYSYRTSRAKPSAELFPPLCSVLREKYGIGPRETLYIGNDMQNDIWTARQAGCSTALFAGDKRSLRLREDHPCCKNLVADAIVVSLDQVYSLF
jgi:putative hydrolase of the HAD superfamily